MLRCRSVSLAIHSHVSTNNFIVMEMLVILMLMLLLMVRVTVVDMVIIDRDECNGVGTGDIIADQNGNIGDMNSKANDNNCDD